VFLSDRLLEELTPDEVEAVFGHEVGHVRHGHLLYYIAFMFLSLTLLTGLWELGLRLVLGVPAGAELTDAALAGMSEVWRYVPAVLLVGAYVFVVFGFLSRRCERQADVYGCRAVSCPEAACAGHAPGLELAPAGRGLCPTGIRTFISALNKVADLNGISRRKPGWLQSWLHASIARRVEFLERLTTDRALEARFQRRLGLLKWGLLVGLVAALAALSLCGYGDAVWAVL
jgi:STE24 endopeptidase